MINGYNIYSSTYLFVYYNYDIQYKKKSKIIFIYYFTLY